LDREAQFKEVQGQEEEAQDYLSNFKVAELKNKRGGSCSNQEDIFQQTGEIDYFRDLAQQLKPTQVENPEEPGPMLPQWEVYHDPTFSIQKQ
jgi:hypothetical protein